MSQKRVLVLVLTARGVPFSPGLHRLSAGLCVGSSEGLPQGWTALASGNLGYPHGYLFNSEQKTDLDGHQGTVYIPPPLHPASSGYRSIDFLTLLENSPEGPVAEGSRNGRLFRIPAVDLSPYKKKRLLPGTPPGPTKLKLPGAPLTLLYARMGPELSDWDPRLFDDLSLVDWSTWEPEKKEPRELYACGLALSPAAKQAGVALGRLRADSATPRPGLLTPPGGSLPLPPAEETGPLTLAGVPTRTLTSSMQGQSRIAGAGMTASFLKGRLTELPWGLTARQIAGPARSYVKFDGRTVPFVAISSFAIEDDGQWGIRETLLAESPAFKHPGRMVCDYFFTDEGHELAMSLSIRWPVFRSPVTINAWAPWELPVARLGWGAQPGLSGWYDGTWSSLNVKGGISRVLAARVSQGARGLTLRLYQQLGHRPHDLSHTLRHGWLCLNPEGGYTDIPARELEGREEHHNWGLSVDTAPFESWAAEPSSYLLPPLVHLPGAG